MKKYESPEMDIIEFRAGEMDVIRTSGEGTGDPWGGDIFED